ncbi:MAG: DUF4160 domain-containing protein [Magnetococcales bacterium]|nr:DUF4160 domain-containing protein [Magnetococcales bacterium]MBF0321416.1 DUF4160 domain-containing protein [Magnetococcales bacterium]
MTTITQIGKIKISVYADDHNLPHFHVASPEADAIVCIRDMVVMGGDEAHAHVNAAIEWAKRHREKIALAWIDMNG